MPSELDTNLSVLECAGEVIFLEDTGRSLSDKVLRKVQDGSYAWRDVVDEFNACLEYLSGKYQLPELEHTEDVQTDAGGSRIPVPANFQKDLLTCRNITHNRPMTVHNSIVNLFRRYTILDQSGPIRDVSVRGRYLHYQRVPGTAEIIRLVYYRFPERLRTRMDKPTCLPPHLVESLLVNYACKELFSEIEDGIEAAQVNTTRYESRFARAEADLVKHIGPPRRAPQEFPEEHAWDSYV